MEEIPELPEDNDGESGAMDVAEDSIEPRAKRVSFNIPEELEKDRTSSFVGGRGNSTATTYQTNHK